MALRCGCINEGDETVFGPRHACLLPERTAVPGEPLPPIPDCAYPPDAVPLPRFVPSSAFVVPGLLDPAESVHASNIQAELDRLEPLYRHVLAPDELEA